MSIVASAPRSSAARALVESAIQAWRTKLPTSKADDCSVVCLFFDHPDTSPETIVGEERKPEQKQQQ